nr:ribonuclease H-like domain-containing protein [Tanacetum cinerariifolium]
MNYKPVVTGTKAYDDASKARMEIVPGKDYILLPVDEDLRQESECKDQEKEDNVNITNNVNVVGTNRVNAVGVNTNNELPFDPEMPALEDISTFNYSSHHEDDDEMADINNLDTTIQVSPMPMIRIHKDHPIDQMDVKSSLLYGKIEKEVYVCQPPRFEDPDFPDKVYKVKKALYGLHQAPKAWYLKGQPKFRLWYPKDYSFDLVAYTDSDYAGASLDRKSTIRVDGKKEIIIESTIRRDFQLKDAEGVDCLPYAAIFEQLTLMRKPRRQVTEVPQPSPIEHIADEAVNEEMNDSLERVTTTATSLDADQDKVNIPRSGEDSLKLNELMELCTKLQQKVLDLEITKTTQALEIDSMKGRVKNLERKKRSRTYGLKRLHKVGLSARMESSKNEGLDEDDASKHGGEEVFVANQDENVVEKEVDAAQVQVTTTATNPTISIDERVLRKLEEMTEGSSKRAEEELEQKNAKKQKIDDDKDIAKLKQLVKIIPDEEG